MDQLEFEKRQAHEFAAKFGDKNYVFLEKKQLRPQVYFIDPGSLCGECKRRSCVIPGRFPPMCIYASIMALKIANTMPKEVPWFEIRATKGDPIYIEDRRIK